MISLLRAFLGDFIYLIYFFFKDLFIYLFLAVSGLSCGTRDLH